MKMHLWANSSFIKMNFTSWCKTEFTVNCEYGTLFSRTPVRQWPKAAWPWDYLVSNVSMWLVPYRPHNTEKEPARKIKLVIFNSRWESEELWGPQSTSRTELLKIWETLVKRIELSFCLECFRSLHPPHADRHACTHMHMHRSSS